MHTDTWHEGQCAAVHGACCPTHKDEPQFGDLYGRNFRQLLEDNGVVFHQVASDLMALLNTEEGRQVMNGGIRHPLREMRYAKEVVKPAFGRVWITSGSKELGRTDTPIVLRK